MSESRVKLGRTVLRLKKDRLQYVKSHWKVSKIYRFSRPTTENFLHQATMVADIFEDFELPPKKFLATPLQSVRFEKVTIEFKNYFKQIPVPFKVYTDF